MGIWSSFKSAIGLGEKRYSSRPTHAIRRDAPVNRNPPLRVVTPPKALEPVSYTRTQTPSGVEAVECTRSDGSKLYLDSNTPLPPAVDNFGIVVPESATANNQQIYARITSELERMAESGQDRVPVLYSGPVNYHLSEERRSKNKLAWTDEAMSKFKDDYFGSDSNMSFREYLMGKIAKESIIVSRDGHEAYVTEHGTIYRDVLEKILRKESSHSREIYVA